MRKKIFFIAGIVQLFIFLRPQSIFSQDLDAKELLSQMIDHAHAVNGFKSVIRKTERIEGKMVLQVSEVKVSRNPYEVYVKQISPKSGVEILCANGCKKALINMNGFPWINLTFDPYGMIMRKHQHHTIHDSGFDLLTSILSRSLHDFRAEEQTLNHKGDLVWHGVGVFNIELINNTYSTKKYKVWKDENIADIAKKFNINEYAILELNPMCDNYEDVNLGQELIIPSHYGVRMNLYINKLTMLPMLIRVYDVQGLFEEYDYTKFELNPKFTDNEFDASFAEYNF